MPLYYVDDTDYDRVHLRKVQENEHYVRSNTEFETTTKDEDLLSYKDVHHDQSSTTNIREREQDDNKKNENNEKPSGYVIFGKNTTLEIPTKVRSHSGLGNIFSYNDCIDIAPPPPHKKNI